MSLTTPVCTEAASSSRASLPALVLLQVTTTGSSLERDSLLEVSLARVKDGQLLDQWHRLISPEYLSPGQLKNQGFTALDQQKGVNTQNLQQMLDQYCQGQLVVAFGLREQLAFLKAAGVQLKAAAHFCLQKAAAELNTNLANKGLLELAEELQLMVLRPYRAPDRLLLLWQLLLRWQDDLSTQLDRLVKQQFQQRLVPAGLNPDLLNQIPDTPGVYRMFAAPSRTDEAPLPLYIGKSIHLRTRVKSHFSADQRSSKSLRLVQQIQFLDWITAAGDLGAQLKEAQQIKKLQPLMNRRLRRQKKLLVWRQTHPGEPLALVPFNPESTHKEGLFWGFFNSAHQAKNQLFEQITTLKLCPVCTGLEKRTAGQACFAYQLGQCRGACCGKEPLQEHQQRLVAALQHWQFDHWPWREGCVLEEQGAGGCEYHALNAWQYLGSSSDPEHVWALAKQSPEYFDKDSYRLLRKVLLPMKTQIHWHGSELRLLPPSTKPWQTNQKGQES